MYLYLVTPILGSLKNYIKYKNFNTLVFLRTLYIYLVLHLSIQTNNTWMILMIERWFFFIFKIIRSIYRNDYIRNRTKYETKYKLIYPIQEDQEER